MTRAERTSRSRELILDAAVDLLVESGHSGATTTAIQARAGVSRGRLLHHFPSRAELLVAAAQHVARRRIQGTETSSPEIVGATGATRIDLVVAFVWDRHHEPYFQAAVQLWAAAQSEPGLAAALLPEERRLGAFVRDTVDRLFGPPFTEHPAYPEVRELLLTSMRGVALMYTFDHKAHDEDTHLQLWRDLARRLLDQ